MSSNPSVPSVFNFNSLQVRAFSDTNGEPWFCANDVCEVLGYANSRDAVSKHCRTPGVAKRDIGVVTGKNADGSEVVQQVEMTFINEGNLYRLIVKSRKPVAQEFEKKLMEEILPSIRKTGGYSAKPSTKALPSPQKAHSTISNELHMRITQRAFELAQASCAEFRTRMMKDIMISGGITRPEDWKPEETRCEVLHGIEVTALLMESQANLLRLRGKALAEQVGEDFDAVVAKYRPEGT